ncbi:MAG: hypothetical protein JXR49_15740 [Acidobacteria bacterium]|nr:hypothetical protein [Acidobacteriota bacterium]
MMYLKSFHVKPPLSVFAGNGLFYIPTPRSDPGPPAGKQEAYGGRDRTGGKKAKFLRSRSGVMPRGGLILENHYHRNHESGHRQEFKRAVCNGGTETALDRVKEGSGLSQTIGDLRNEVGFE